MDKASIALATAEDNAAAIRELSKRISRRTACRVIGGKANADGVTSFGNVTSYGDTGVYVMFSGTKLMLRFCGKDVVASAPPIMAVLPAGSGELTLSASRVSTALVIGGA